MDSMEPMDSMDSKVFMDSMDFTESMDSMASMASMDPWPVHPSGRGSVLQSGSPRFNPQRGYFPAVSLHGAGDPIKQPITPQSGVMAAKRGVMDRPSLHHSTLRGSIKAV